MKVVRRIVFFATCIFFIGTLNIAVLASENEAWWPSRYGEADQCGTLNELSSDKVIEALKLIGNGQIYQLGTEYKSENPGYPPRFWETTTLAHPLRTLLGTNKLTWLEEEFAGCPGKGTQLDGPAHIALEYKPCDLRFYSGFKLSNVLTAKATLAKFGMEKVPAIVTRGVLVDMVAYKGRAMEMGEKVSVEDIEGFLKQHSLALKPGDALMINTGWMRWFYEDPEKFMTGEPGITKDVIPWLYDKRVAFIGTDQWATEVLPSENPKEVFPVHGEALTKRGFYWGQNFRLDGLAKDKVYEFTFIFTVPKIVGSTQGIGNPIAIANGPDPQKAPMLFKEPKGEKWWPSRYGKDDEMGTLNELHGGKVTEAATLVKKGEIFDLGTKYEESNPGYPPRYWHNSTLAHPLRTTLGINKLTWLEEVFIGCPGKGTQIDSPAHIALEYKPGDLRFYNGYKLPEVLTGKARLDKFGIEKALPIVTRGILVDMVTYRGRELEKGEKITVADIEGFLKQHNLTLRPGDALLINTGWMRWFWEDPVKFMSGEPGITKDVVKWLYAKRVSFIATDQWATEVLPSENPTEVFPVHGEALTKRGFYWGQNYILGRLAQDCLGDGTYEFMFVFTNPKITGSTQGIGNPIAIK